MTTLVGCKTTKLIDKEISELHKSCYEYVISHETSKASTFEPEDYDETLLDAFSKESLLVANTIGQIDPITKLFKEDKFNDFSQFRTYQKIINNITLAELEVFSFTSAIRCEEDKMEQLAWFMERLESDASSKNTVTGILIDASANIASAAIIIWAINGNTVRQLLGVGASLTQIFLNLRGRSITYIAEVEHPVNILNEIFEGEEWSDYVPVNIWYYLDNRSPDFTDRSIKVLLMDSWEEYNIRENKSLYLSSGGNYTSQQLRNRASMLEQLASYTELILQDLLKLRQELEDYIDEQES
ncbi:hypothetical protein [Pararhodonellum marinum]|uniref:hypothetical protein n=1 Tax=Pararhodonellum marinum TaxID=2755358 RepID=UPI00188E6817|nr:hypothetical protein [Pararhodonellum marinum]